ncbi:hypothetical protein FQZ97_865260 [compost metagenome]
MSALCRVRSAMLLDDLNQRPTRDGIKERESTEDGVRRLVDDMFWPEPTILRLRIKQSLIQGDDHC